MKYLSVIFLIILGVINVKSQADGAAGASGALGVAGPQGPPGIQGPPGPPGLPAPCQDKCNGMGCEPECFVGCCGYHGMYGKSGKWIREQILQLAESDSHHEPELV